MLQRGNWDQKANGVQGTMDMETTMNLELRKSLLDFYPSLNYSVAKNVIYPFSVPEEIDEYRQESYRKLY